MSDLVKSNPILAQYVPKPTQGFQTFGYQQGAQNVETQQIAETGLATERQETEQSKAAQANVEAQIASVKSQLEQAKQEKAQLQAEEASAKQQAEAAAQAASQAQAQAQAVKAQADQARASILDPKSVAYGEEMARVVAAENARITEIQRANQQVLNNPEVQQFMSNLMRG
jgi:chromosome segregation ATPase